MNPYDHTQPGTLLRRVFGTLIVAFVTGAVVTANGLPFAAIIFAAAAGVLALTAFLFSSLRVSVDSSEISLAFGPGWIRKGFPASEIDSARIVQNRWFYGWGIRYTPHGWLYNVSGWDAVEIELKSGKKYRIGTDEPTKLAAAIGDAILPT